jgi:hypothetical protein
VWAPSSVLADPVRWPQPDGLGTPVSLSYSYINLLNPEFERIPQRQLRAATEEAFGLWSAYAPLNFRERPDSGPPAVDRQYRPTGYPDIRIGARPVDDGAVLAYAYFPLFTDSNGLAGDIYFNTDSAWAWGIGEGFPTVDFLEVMTHEIGHALGVMHIMDLDAILNPEHGFRFSGLGSGFLLAPDIAAVRALYGPGVGSVQPMPEPGTVLLVATGVLALFGHFPVRGRSTIVVTNHADALAVHDERA